jgi:hypothetical protein
MFFNTYQPEPEKSPFDKCKELLITIRLEQRKREPDPDALTKLHRDLYSHKVQTITAAFNAVVDEQGW